MVEPAPVTDAAFWRSEAGVIANELAVAKQHLKAAHTVMEQQSTELQVAYNELHSLKLRLHGILVLATPPAAWTRQPRIGGPPLMPAAP